MRLNGEVPAQEFLEKELEQIREKGKDKPEGTARARFMVLFQHMANYGPSGLTSKRFRSEMKGFCAFCHEVRNSQIRFPCFPDGPQWVLTHGFIKPGAKKGRGKWPQSEIDRALEIRGEYFQRKKSGQSARRGQQNDQDAR